MCIVIRLRYETKLTEKYRSEGVFLFCLIFRWREVGHTLGFGSKENVWAITTVKYRGQNKFSCGEKAALQAFLAFLDWLGNQMLMHDQYRNSWD